MSLAVTLSFSIHKSVAISWGIRAECEIILKPLVKFLGTNGTRTWTSCSIFQFLEFSKSSIDKSVGEKVGTIQAVIRYIYNDFDIRQKLPSALLFTTKGHIWNEELRGGV